jgi:hypothetical protein
MMLNKQITGNKRTQLKITIPSKPAQSNMAIKTQAAAAQISLTPSQQLGSLYEKMI